MGIRKLHQKQQQLEAIKAQVAHIKNVEKEENRKVNGRRLRLMGEVIEEWFDAIPNNPFIGKVDVAALKNELLQALEAKLTNNYDRELFGFSLHLTERELEERRLIIKGRILEKWLEWGRISQENYQQWLNAFLTRSYDRKLFQLPPLTDEGVSTHDLDAEKKSTNTQKVILKGRLLERLVQSGDISQAQYQEGLEGFLKIDSDRALFGLSPLPKEKKKKKLPAKKKQGQTTATPTLQNNTQPPLSETPVVSPGRDQVSAPDTPQQTVLGEKKPQTPAGDTLKTEATTPQKNETAEAVVKEKKKGLRTQEVSIKEFIT